MSRRERISIHSKGTECEDGHGNNAAYGGGKKKDLRGSSIGLLE